MNSKLARLRLAALVAIACTASTVRADNVWKYYEVTLSWSVPTQNIDGSPLIDLQGYYIYAGDAPDAMIPMYYADVPHSSMVVGYWAAEPRYFAISAVNVDGVESTLTGPVAQVPQ
jgi:hypothetical protein